MIRSGKYFTLLTLFCTLHFTGSSIASEYDRSTGLSLNVGEHNSLLLVAAEFSYASQKDKFYVTYTPLLSAGIGYQHALDSNNKHALGVFYGASGEVWGTSRKHSLITYDYYFNGLNNDGLSLGFKVGQLNDRKETRPEEVWEKENVIYLGLGYRF